MKKSPLGMVPVWRTIRGKCRGVIPRTSRRTGSLLVYVGPVSLRNPGFGSVAFVNEHAIAKR